MSVCRHGCSTGIPYSGQETTEEYDSITGLKNTVKVIMINNAGTAILGTLVDMPTEQGAFIQTNFMRTYYVTHAVLSYGISDEDRPEN